MKKAKIIVCVFFLVLLAALTFASMVNPVRESSESENRPLAQMPEFSLEAIFGGEFTKGYEDFVTDQFVWRDAWINIKSRVERLLGKTASNGVYFGKDGYFIERVTENDIDREQLDKNIGQLEKFLENMTPEIQNKPVIALAPVAAMILEDKLPWLADEYDWDTLFDSLSERFGDSFVDLRPVLRANKDDYVYYRTDHHWTTDGAYLAYTEIIKKFGFKPLSKDEFDRVEVSDSFLGTVIAKLNIKSDTDTIVRYDPKEVGKVTLNYNNGALVADSFYNDDKLLTRDKYAYFLGDNTALIEVGTENKNGRVLIMAKDSYANCMLPMLACHFEKIYVIDMRYFNAGMVSYAKQLGDVTDALVLYNVSGFSSAKELVKLYN